MGKIKQKASWINVLLVLSMLCSFITPTAFANTHERYIGNVKLNGDVDFDSDSILNDESGQWRWNSYPQSRMVINPGSRPQYDKGMTLNAGIFVKGVHRAEGLQKFQVNSMDFASVSTGWLPYKLTAKAQHSNGAILSMDEFFADKNTFVRLVQLEEVSGKTLNLSGKLNNSTITKLADNSIPLEHENYYMVERILLLDANGVITQIVQPVISGTSWKADIPFTENTGTVAFSMTLGVKNDHDHLNANDAYQRAKDITESKTLPQSLADTKETWDHWLGKVPAPTEWGIKAIDAKGVTPEQHRRSFYAAWAYKYQNIIEPTPENDYDFYQVTLGMASMWANGTAEAPNSCSWESFFDIQQISMVEPEIAWDAAKGFIYSIDDNGTLSGECLPSQKAHTVWVVYDNLMNNPNVSQEIKVKATGELSTMYVQVRKYLIWRAANPRWIFGGHNYADEKDISFVAQWFNDVEYAIKIAEVLGDYSDMAMWESMKVKMGEDVTAWFVDPNGPSQIDEHNELKGMPHKIYNTYFVNSGAHYSSARPIDRANYIFSALVADLPKDFTNKLVENYLAFHKKDHDLAGYEFYKYGDGAHSIAVVGL